MQTQNSKLKTHNCRQRGFTLLELLLAMALLVIISAALYGTYFALMRGRETAVAGMESRRELRGTLDMVQREIAAAFYSGNNKRLHFKVEDRDFFGKPASILDFTTISPPRSGTLPLSDQTEVRYRPVESDGKIMLMREARDLYATAEPLPYPQMEELEGFLVECSPDGTNWVRTWDTTLNRVLPEAVRVTVRVRVRVREGEKSAEFAVVASPKVVP